MPTRDAAWCHGLPHLDRYLAHTSSTFQKPSLALDDPYSVSIATFPLIIAGICVLPVLVFLVVFLCRLTLRCMPAHSNARLTKYSLFTRQKDYAIVCFTFGALAVIALHLLFLGDSQFAIGVSDSRASLRTVTGTFAAVVAAATAASSDATSMLGVLNSCSPVSATCNTYIAALKTELAGVQSDIAAFSLLGSSGTSKLSDVDTFLTSFGEDLRPVFLFVVYALGMALLAGYAVGFGRRWKTLLKANVLCTVLFVLGLITVATAMLSVSMAAGDFCMDPSHNFVDNFLPTPASPTTASLLAYYASCSGTDPLQPATATTVADNQALMSNVTAAAQGSCSGLLDAATFSVYSADAAAKISVPGTLSCAAVSSAWHTFLETNLCDAVLSGLVFQLSLMYIIALCFFMLAMFAAALYPYYELERQEEAQDLKRRTGQFGSVSVPPTAAAGSSAGTGTGSSPSRAGSIQQQQQSQSQSVALSSLPVQHTDSPASSRPGSLAYRSSAADPYGVYTGPGSAGMGDGSVPLELMMEETYDRRAADSRRPPARAVYETRTPDQRYMSSSRPASTTGGGERGYRSSQPSSRVNASIQQPPPPQQQLGPYYYPESQSSSRASSYRETSGDLAVLRPRSIQVLDQQPYYVDGGGPGGPVPLPGYRPALRSAESRIEQSIRQMRLVDARGYELISPSRDAYYEQTLPRPVGYSNLSNSMGSYVDGGGGHGRLPPPPPQQQVEYQEFVMPDGRVVMRPVAVTPLLRDRPSSPQQLQLQYDQQQQQQYEQYASGYTTPQYPPLPPSSAPGSSSGRPYPHSHQQRTRTTDGPATTGGSSGGGVVNRSRAQSHRSSQALYDEERDGRGPATSAADLDLDLTPDDSVSVVGGGGGGGSVVSVRKPPRKPGSRPLPATGASGGSPSLVSGEGSVVSEGSRGGHRYTRHARSAGANSGDDSGSVYSAALADGAEDEGYSTVEANKLLQLHLSELHRLYGTALFAPALSGSGGRVWSRREVRALLQSQEDRHAALIDASPASIVPPDIDVLIDSRPPSSSSTAARLSGGGAGTGTPSRRGSRGSGVSASSLRTPTESGSRPPPGEGSREGGRESRDSRGGRSPAPPSKPSRKSAPSGTSGVGSRPQAGGIVRAPRTKEASESYSTREVNEHLQFQAQEIYRSLGAVLYCAPLTGDDKEYTKEQFDKVMQINSIKCAAFDQQNKATFSALEVNSMLEEQASFLGRCLGQFVSFSPVEGGKHTKAQVRALLQEQQKEHIDLFRSVRKEWDAAADDGTDSSGFRQLSAFIYKLNK